MKRLLIVGASCILIAGVIAIALHAGNWRAFENVSAMKTPPLAETVREERAVATSNDLRANESLSLATPTSSRSEEVKQLLGTGLPKDAFRAWSLLAACNDSMRNEHDARANTKNGPPEWLSERSKALATGELAKEVKAVCGDLQPSHINRRLEYLDKAADAGIPAAIFALVREGPWGDKSAMYSRWKDPAVQAWLERVLSLLKLAARSGDLDAMTTLADQYRDGGGLVAEPNLQTALMYATAYEAAYERQQGRSISAFRKREIQELSARLPLDQAAKGRSDGLQLAGAKQ